MSLKNCSRILLAFIIIQAGAFAKSMDIKEAAGLSIKNNPEVLSCSLSWQAAKAKAVSAVSLDDLRLSLEYEKIPSGSRNLEDGEKMYKAEQMVEFPGKIYAEYLMAVKDSDAKKALYDGKAAEVSSRAKSAYLDLFYADRAVEVLSDIKTILLSAKRSAIARYTVGGSPQTDALMANIEYLAADNELLVMRQERKAKEAVLKSVLNITEAGTIETTAGLDLPKEIGKEADHSSSALSRRPELAAMKAEAEMRDAEVLKNRMSFFPDIGLGVKKRVNDGWDAMFSISVPLYFWKQGYKTVSSGLDEDSVSASIRNMRNMTISEVSEAYVEAVNALQTARLYQREIIPQSRDAYKVSVSAYKGGRIDFQTVIQIERTYKEARLKYYESQVRLGKALAMLDRLKGDI